VEAFAPNHQKQKAKSLDSRFRGNDEQKKAQSPDFSLHPQGEWKRLLSVATMQMRELDDQPYGC
jgi:hypothetical protein